MLLFESCTAWHCMWNEKNYRAESFLTQRLEKYLAIVTLRAMN
jgi:hypothetical protein